MIYVRPTAEATYHSSSAQEHIARRCAGYWPKQGSTPGNLRCSDARARTAYESVLLMEPNYEYVGAYARRYIDRARKLYEVGDTNRADAFAAVASAFQLFPPGRRNEVPRGEFFGPMASGSFGEIPDMSFIRRPDTIGCLRARMARTRNQFRRARIADTVWEFAEHPDPEAARIAADAYLDAGSFQLKAPEEFAAMMGAGAMARSLALARAINDQDRVGRATAAFTMAIRNLAGGDEHVALFTLVESLLRLGRDVNLQPAEDALREHLERLAGRDDDNFHFRRAILELQIQLARRRGDAEEVKSLQRQVGESIADEAAWKGAHYDNGGLVAMHFYAKAAEHFEKLGDRKRADELHRRERESFGGARFSSIGATVDLDLKPYRDWLEKVFKSGQGETLLWAAILKGVPLPTLEEIGKQHDKATQDSPLLSMMGVSTVRPEGVLEDVPADEAARRRAQTFAYQAHGLHVATLIRLAMEEHSTGATRAGLPLHATGLFDKTADALLERVLRAIEERDWLAAGYLAGPLIERVVRTLATKAQIEVMYTERGGGRPRRQRVAIEVLMRQLPLHEDVLGYAKWTMTHPGLNVRNEAGHGLLEVDACNEVLGAHILYTLLALCFSDLVLVTPDLARPAT